MIKKSKRLRVLIIIFLLAYVSLFNVKSQLPFSENFTSDYSRAMELFNKEKYPAAIRLFDSFIKNEGKDNIILKSEAEYYSALAALRVFNADAEYRMLSYIYNNPESPRINDAYLELAGYFYQNKNYRKAANYYKAVNRQLIAPDRLPEYYFHTGYSLYMQGDKKGALLMFSEIKDIDTEFTPAANYYFAHIAYEQKMYQTAMEGFVKLKDDETFGRVVPFYIVQILYLQKNYDAILEMAPALLGSAGKEREIELYRFIGDAYYNKGNYAEAISYLEKYTSEAKTSGREDKFQLGYCYYKTGDTDKAIKTLLEIDAKNDLLSQNVWNILADCYLKKGDKIRARFGFGEASKLDFDKNIKEESLFNYARLTYEISNSPFGEAIEAFQRYIDQFPGSERIQEAYDYLVGTYTQLKNYKAALASLDKIRNKDSRLETAYQRVAFFRGLELFRNLQFSDAVDMFDRSLKYEKYNRSLRARAVYWRGEANYRLARYAEARKDYETFMGLPGSSLLDEYNMVRYNLGSACFNMQDYKSALSNFKAFEENGKNVKPEVLADTRNRIADCYYISTDYRSAIQYYDLVINSGAQDADYAMFQKGFSLGLTNDQKGKIDVLSGLIAKYPSSALIPNAVFERGRAYVVIEDFRKGQDDFNSVIANYQNSPFVPRAIVQLGLLYYNLGENENAVTQFKKVIENYPSTPEARYAMTGLRNAYVDMNDVESYFAYVKTVDGYGDVDSSTRDSLMYTSGENLYMTAKYDRATETFRNYLKEFPNGIFRQNASFYLAESLRYAGKDDEALSLYTDVASRPNNQFTERALIEASEIMYNKEDYQDAYTYYQKLESVAGNDENKLIALRGQLRSAFEAGDAAEAISAADRINKSAIAPDELRKEAYYISAKANYSLNNYDAALSDFRKVATEVTSEQGAESKYMVAELLNRSGQTAEAEKIIQEFINQNTPHQYWMARIFLLLSDISIAKGDTLQAKATLQSLRDYYSVQDDGVLDEVKKKLESIEGNK